jgi:toxin ParE1/3/4
LANNPLLGPERPDVAPGLRFLVAGSYLILYRTLDTGVEIVRVLHGARDVNGLFAAD